MPVPATTGQLRTRIEDMQIGDYISALYSANSGHISRIGETPTGEMELTGINTGANWFYFVKVAKGLLVADRICHHTVSWMALNKEKLIDGRPLWSTAIPRMTANNAPFGVASASSIYSTSYDAWKAFDRVDNPEGWVTKFGALTGWLEYSFGGARIVSYSMKAPNSAAYDEMARDWTFEAWDGAKWIVLDTQVNQLFKMNEIKYYNIINPNTYQKYRVNVTANNGSTSYIGIQELGMSELPANEMTLGSIIRSLTGGVAHLNKGNNADKYNRGLGGWPSYNEWDRYIVNFPKGLIAQGKTLDDIFHWSVSNTMTRDTFMFHVVLGTYSPQPTWRVFRGGVAGDKKENTVWGGAADNYTATSGFRPVLEYKEV